MPTSTILTSASANRSSPATRSPRKTRSINPRGSKFPTCSDSFGKSFPESPIMPPTRFSLALLTMLGVGTLALVQSAPAPDEKPKAAEPFHDQLLDIAKNYVSYGRVDDEMRWAPTACRPPTDPKPGVARFSESTDTDTHGRKLYSVFAKSGTARSEERRV